MSAIQHPHPASSTRRTGAQLAALLLVSFTTARTASAAEQPHDQIVKIVTRIQRADYEGDRPALKRLHGELTPFVDNKELATRVQYWRGFALWRRAINGFNDNAAPAELQEDLEQASAEFADAAKKDSTFVDATIGELSCVGYLAYSIRIQDPASPRFQELITQSRQLRKDAEAAAPDNPRLLWVVGPILWNTPPERGGGQAKALESYEKGLATIRNNKTPARDPLEPAWGEPELLMSLAWSKLSQATPDMDAAEQDADAALKIVPYWHYVRDILVPQIRAVRKK
jgi:hypothetical protein